MSAALLVGACVLALIWYLWATAKPYRLDLVWIWRQLHPVSPHLMRRTAVRLGGDRDPLHLGHSWDSDDTEIYLGLHPSAGEAVATILHEWAHHTQRGGRHDADFWADLRRWAIRAGLGRRAASSINIEGAIAVHFDRRYKRTKTRTKARWRRWGRVVT